MIDVGKVAMISIADIEVGERARQEMGDLNGLEGSMKQSGLVAPLCVKEHDGDRPYYLLAGERRLGILIKNGNEEIPVRVYSHDISDLEIASIELAENFYHKHFEHWEYDNQVRKIHALQQSVHGKKVSTLSDASGWGMQETAELMGVTKASISTAIKRADAREAFPELFTGCKSQKDASKVLDKLNEAVIKETLAKKIESQKLSGGMRTLVNGFVLGDFFEKIKEIPSGSMHLVEIDPPYAINLPEQKKKDGESIYTLDNYNEVEVGKYPDFLYSVFKESYRIMSDHSWLICWFAPEPWFETVHQLLIKAGLGTTRMCGVWTKGSSGQNMNPSTRLANSYEMFFYAWKGQPALAKAGRGNEFSYSPVPPARKTHPTERPVELMKDVYETFAFQGSRVLIPFLGSGVGLFAAHELGMSALGFEIGKAYKDSFLVKAHAMLC